MKRLLLISLALICCTLVWADRRALLISANQPAAAAAGNNLLANLMAWYDFADNSDGTGTYDLVETNSPSYTAGSPNYGTAVASSKSAWLQGPLGTNFVSTTNHEWSYAIRFKAATSATNLADVIQFSNDRTYINLFTTNSMKAVLLNKAATVTTFPPRDTWCVVAATFNTNDMVINVFTNGAYFGDATSGSFQIVSQIMSIGANLIGDKNYIDADYDWAGFWDRELLTNEVEWLYNSAGTRTYSELQ